MTDLDYMTLALEEAKKAADNGEVPIGAIVMQNPIEGAGAEKLINKVQLPRVIAKSGNAREALNDPTAHAELIAIRLAAEQLERWRLTDCTLYVTLEPCIMCAGALHQARIARCVYGASDKKAGALGTLYKINEDTRLNHNFEVVPGVMADESAQLLKDFFAKRR